jgi:hypothetical protein
MGFKKINNITGWIVFAIASITYLLTMEATASLWDCGEFLSTAYRLEVGHSPGAPLFMMLGRLFGIFAPSAAKVALFINSMSAFMSSFTILFLFWTITHFARKLFVKEDETISTPTMIGIMGAGAVGALAYTFSDTFWFSAVEAEVYATSSFFTAIVFWAILKWEHTADEPHADRWLILIFYLMGLSIGVHLLNLLTIPAIIMVYYFRKKTPTVKGGITAFLIGIAILAFVQFGVIQYVPIIAAQFELLFVNSFGMPLNTGAIFFLLLVFALLAWLVIWAKRKGKYILHLSTLCVIFVIIGYSSYISIIIRSKADVPIDMGNPDNVMTLIPYLQRDQYGSQPLVKGPDFTSNVVGVEDGRKIYAAVEKDGKMQYELVSHKPVYQFDHEVLFPRMWDFNDQNHVNFYKSYLNLSDIDLPPSSVDNQKFFWSYQMNWMWWRYVMWNFAGRQNDVEGQGEARHGNWISGIKGIDKMMGRGDIDLLPDALKNSKARNQLYFLPLILGFMGFFYQLKRNKYDFTIVGLLFFFTGIAIVLYLNNTPQQPRERDYAYAGSTYAFAIWIGLGVLMLSDILKKYMKGAAPTTIATIVCLLAVPTLMAAEEWDDHDRSEKTIARDHALNLLNSCDSNAILITYGDNDTYPLWYLQEIEGIRTDVRIINHNLLGTDWQNDQLTFKINNADAIPVIWKPEQYRGAKLEYISYREDPRIAKDRYYDIEEVIKLITSISEQNSTANGRGSSFLPTQNLSIKLDKEALIKAGLWNANDSTVLAPVMQWQLKQRGLSRADLSLMNIIAGQAKEGWKRPIYMTDGTPNLGLDAYFKSEGLLRKFVPGVPQNAAGGIIPFTNVEKNMKYFTQIFSAAGAKNNNIYYDEKNRQLFFGYRQNFAEFAMYLVLMDKKQEAIQVLDKYLASISETSLPLDITLYDRSGLFLVNAYYAAGAQDKARALADKIVKSIKAEIAYFQSLNSQQQSGGIDLYLAQMNMGGLQLLGQMAGQGGDQEYVNKMLSLEKQLAPSVPSNNNQ